MDDLRMLLNTQLFAEDLDSSAANVDTDADSEEVSFDDGVASTATEQNNDSDGDDKKLKTKEYSDRLKADREKIRKELEAELDNKQNEKLNQIAKKRGYEDWKELEEYERAEQIKELGVEDTSKFEQYLDEVISKNPKIAEAEAIIARHKQEELNRQLEEEVKVISQLDNSIKTIDDVLSHPKYDEMLSRVQTGMSLTDAYKIVNFDVLATKQVKTAEQTVYDKLNSKAHLNSTKGAAATDIIVPSEIFAIYKKNFKTWTDEQIKEHYKNEMGGSV